ncbi:uncharacterized protein [Antedon mediterranea]|uniref:uncharacterized protein isoform X2 n=1 Tax=Antedon mediterranea TaxID=105859 RepID=UPI003AF9D5AC
MASSKEISEDDFNQLMTDTAEWYDRYNYLTPLKLLYKDHLAMSNVHVERAKSVMDLLQDLTASGSLSSSNLTILYDTVKITKQFGFKSKIKNQPPEDIKDHKVIMLTSYRQKLFQLGAELNSDEVSTLDSLHNNPVKRYQDSWSLIMDFEHRGIIDEDVTKMDRFLTALKANQMNWALKIFMDDVELHESVMETSSYNTEECNLTPTDKEVPYDQINESMNLQQIVKTSIKRKALLRPTLTKKPKLDHGKTSQSSKLTKKQKLDHEKDFNFLKITISGYFDARNQLGMLKVLLKDRVKESKLSRIAKTIDLLNVLESADEFNYLTLLHDVIKLTEEFSLQRKLKEKIASFPVIDKQTPITRFTIHRQKLVEFGYCLTPSDVSKIDANYNTPLKDYEDSWAMIRDLEHKQVITPTKMEEFIEILERLELKRAVCILQEGETVMKPSSSNSKETIKMFLKEELQELYKNMNLMGTAVFDEEHKVDIADVFTDLTLLQSTKQKQVDQATRQQEAKPTCLEEVLEIIKSNRSCKVLLTGEGGMGKTTLLRYIAYNWAEVKDDTFSDKILFLINIRDIEVGKTIIDSIVKQINLRKFANRMKNIFKSEDSVDQIANFITENEDEIVILLDGLDELNKGAENPLNLLYFRSNDNNTTLITSRPVNISTFVENCDVHVQVNGFSKESKKLYIEKYFKHNPELGEKLITKLNFERSWRIENETKHLKELCSSPLLLLIICSMCEQSTSKPMADEILPITMSDFFKEFICCTLNQHTKVEENKIAEICEIQAPYKKAILALGQCMFNGLKENKLYIHKNEFDGMIDKDTVELALKLGFVYKKASSIKTDRKAVFAPPHKLVSEALAGFYLANACLSNDMKEEECKKMLLNPYLHMTIIFTIEFLGKDAGKMIKHWLKVKTAANYYSLAKYFSYVKPEHEIHVIRELPNISTDAVCEIRNVLPYDKTIENKHLVQLMNICYERFKENWEDIVDTLKNITKTKDTKATKTFCSMLVHIYIIVHGLLSDQYKNYKDGSLFKLHSLLLLEDSEIDTLSAEMDSFQFKYRFRNIHFTTSTNPKFLIHLLTFSFSTLCLNFKPGSITGDVLNHVIDQVNDISLEFEQIDLSDNDLSSISVGSLTILINITHDINLSNCQLSGEVFNALFNKKGKVLSNVIKQLCLKGNDLSGIDGVSLSKLVNLMDCKYGLFKWSNYSFSVGNLESLADACHEHNHKLPLKRLDLTGLHLAAIKGSKLAWLLQFSPELFNLDLVNCNLSGTIIRDLLKECEVNKVTLKPGMLNLKDNNLSDIDGVSLSKLVNLMDCKYGLFKWSNYRKSGRCLP